MGRPPAPTRDTAPMRRPLTFLLALLPFLMASSAAKQRKGTDDR